MIRLGSGGYQETTITNKVHLLKQYLLDGLFQVQKVTVSLGHLDWLSHFFVCGNSKLEQIDSLSALDNFVKELDSHVRSIVHPTVSFS